MDSGAFLYTTAVGICAGIAGALLFGMGVMHAIIFLGIAALVLPMALVTRRKIIIFAAIACASIAIGIIRADFFADNFSRQTILSFARQEPVVVDGMISADPDERDMTTHVQVAVTKIDGVPASGEIIVYLPPVRNLSYGDRVHVRGTLQSPAPFMGDAGNEFDYPRYLEVKNISAVLNKAEIISSETGGLSIPRVLYGIREKFDASIGHLYSQPAASLLQGMLFGERRGLSADVQQTLVSVGLIHIVILAGYALSLVARAIGSAANIFPKKFRLPIVAAVLIVYILMTGGAASTVRAGIMAIIAMIARMSGRASLALRSLAAAVVLMVLWNPPMLLWDSGFIVSTLATFGLITLGTSLHAALRFLPEQFELREIAASTLSVQIFALPALLYYTGSVSLVSIPANLLALPALPYAMLFGFLSAAFNLIHPAFAFIPALIANVLVHYILFIAQTAAGIPYGSATLFAFPGWGTLLIYIPLTLLAGNEYLSGNRLKKSLRR